MERLAIHQQIYDAEKGLHEKNPYLEWLRVKPI